MPLSLVSDIDLAMVIGQRQVAKLSTRLNALAQHPLPEIKEAMAEFVAELESDSSGILQLATCLIAAIDKTPFLSHEAPEESVKLLEKLRIVWNVMMPVLESCPDSDVATKFFAYQVVINNKIAMLAAALLST